MDVIVLQIFVSLGLVVGSLLLFAFSTKQRDHEHNDRLALLPLDNDRAPLDLSHASDTSKNLKEEQ
ncbi:MAG: hypothetical protein U0271_23035 [Polyangiaceae bacterium]